ncbi:YqaA family protein [Halomicrobium urmianum]|uniref:YqaA family protein n=1 Tax=Halomicrobium urmianum TaxID=1586233 RepID=UPI0035716979
MKVVVPLEGLPVLLASCPTTGDPVGFERAVCTATGPVGLLLIGVYSFLIAFVLPLPSEIVLAPASSLRLGLPTSLDLAVVIVISGLGKAAGSVFAFHLGQEAKQSGPVVRFLRRSRFDVVAWSERRTVELAQQFGYVGLALALSVPGFPDTLSIYAFSVLEEDYLKFALATFAGSVGRLLVTLGLIGGASLAF